MCRRDNAYRNRDEERESERDRGKDERVWQALANFSEDRTMCNERIAPVALHDLHEPLGILDRHGIVQAVFIFETLQVSRRDVRVVRERGKGIVRRNLNQREHDEADDEQQRNGLKKPTNDVTSHAAERGGRSVERPRNLLTICSPKCLRHSRAARSNCSGPNLARGC